MAYSTGKENTGKEILQQDFLTKKKKKTTFNILGLCRGFSVRLRMKFHAEPWQLLPFPSQLSLSVITQSVPITLNGSNKM